MTGTDSPMLLVLKIIKNRDIGREGVSKIREFCLT